MLDPVFLRPIAHRGLHDARRGIVENTASAFTAAIAGDWGIECDLQPASDAEPMVFHDRTLGRLIEGSGLITARMPAELQRLRYSRAPQETIMRFAELLELVAGRVPLIVEIKTEWRLDPATFYERIATLARAYQGPLVLKSFDPAVMVTFRQLAPSIPRGLVSGSFRGAGWWAKELTHRERFLLRHLAYAAAVWPSFISYDIKSLPSPVPLMLRRRFGLPLFAWTIRTRVDEAKAARLADAIIFEGYTPAARPKA